MFKLNWNILKLFFKSSFIYIKRFLIEQEFLYLYNPHYTPWKYTCILGKQRIRFSGILLRHIKYSNKGVHVLDVTELSPLSLFKLSNKLWLKTTIGFWWKVINNNNIHHSTEDKTINDSISFQRFSPGEKLKIM